MEWILYGPIVLITLYMLVRVALAYFFPEDT
jgi:hypothetical protein